MKPAAKGFTLIELMIVVSIIGTLAALAIPAYQDYVIRAQVAEGLRLAAGARSAVEDHFAQNGVWPADNSAAALADQHDIVGRYTQHVNVQANVIEIEYALDAHHAIHNKNVLLTASSNDGSISWSCTGVGIPDHQLPQSCRGRPAKIR